MRKIILLATLILGCSNVVRDKDVYKSELSFIRELNTQEVSSLKDYLKGHCDCNNLSSKCSKALRTLIVADVRMGWHLDMMAHNADVGPKPGDLPEIPTMVSYCKEL
jgi:hypothetical protein